MFCSVWLPKCLHWPLCPGVFIAILAFVAAAVTFRENPGKREKAAWTFLLSVFMWAEVWMMSSDRESSEAQQQLARNAQLKGFNDIGDGINATITNSGRQFQATMKGLDTLQTSERTLRNTQPYATLEFQRMRPSDPSPSIAVDSQLEFNLWFTTSGTAPARNSQHSTMIYVRRPDSSKDEKQITNDFNEHSKLSR